jgi:hypothetical protein
MVDAINIDNRVQYSGKTVRKNRYFSKSVRINRYYSSIKRTELYNKNEIRRISNEPYLTSFDVDFNLFPRYLCGKHPDFYKLSEVNHERAIQYLESNAVSKRKNDLHTTYLIPIIGIFDYNDYDKKKNKYIFTSHDEHGTPYSTMNICVEYKIDHLYNAKLLNDKNIRPRDYYDYNHNKYGSKYYRKQSDFYFE